MQKAIRTWKRPCRRFPIYMQFVSRSKNSSQIYLTFTFKQVAYPNTPKALAIVCWSCLLFFGVRRELWAFAHPWIVLHAVNFDTHTHRPKMKHSKLYFTKFCMLNSGLFSEMWLHAFLMFFDPFQILYVDFWLLSLLVPRISLIQSLFNCKRPQCLNVIVSEQNHFPIFLWTSETPLENRHSETKKEKKEKLMSFKMPKWSYIVSKYHNALCDTPVG